MTDCTNWVRLGIATHYVYQQKPVVRVIEYVKCNNIRGETIAILIAKSLKGSVIGISYCRSQTYVGAENMAGKQNGAAVNFQKILRMIEHYIITVPLTN